MHALNHHICPQVQCGRRKHGVIPKMGSMGFIHNQRKSCPVNDLGNGLYVGYDSVIGGAYNEDCLCVHIPLKHPVHIFRRDSSLYPQSFYLLWINIGGFKLIQINSVVHGFMAVPAHQDSAVSGYCSAYSGKNPAGTSINQIIGLVRPVDIRRPFHGIPQDSFRVVKIIKPVNLRYVHCPGIGKAVHRARHALMPGHMEGIHVRTGISSQAVNQKFFLFHHNVLSRLRNISLVMLSFNCFRLRTTSVLCGYLALMD